MSAKSVTMTPDEVASLTVRHRRWSIVAALTGALGFFLAIIVPMLPVEHTTTTISWPQSNVVEPITAPLVAYYPRTFIADVPCSAITDLVEQGQPDATVVATAPSEASEKAAARGLRIALSGDTVEVRSRNSLIASAPVAAVTAPGGCSHIHVAADSSTASAEFVGLILDGSGVGGRIDSTDVRPQVVGVFSDLSGQVPEGLNVTIEVDSRYTTSPSLLKQLAVILGVLLTVASLIALHRLDTRDQRRGRRAVATGWWKPRPLDVVVIATLLVWHVIGANTADDGYILTESRAAVSSGYMPEVFRYYGAPYAPFGMPYYLYTVISAMTPASIWLRLPALLLAVATWALLSREVIPRLGPMAARSRAVRWSTAAVFLAFWLTYNNGLRPEPIIAFGVLATWVCLERAIATRRLLPAALALTAGGFTLSAAPTGTFCIAAIIAASPPLLVLVVKRARRDGWLPTLAPLLAAGTAVLHWVFFDQPLVTTLQSSALLGEVGPTGAWYEETWRYEWLMNPTPDGSLARRFAVLIMLLSLLTCAAVLLRKRRIPGAALGPSMRIVGMSALSIAFMMFNPTKWTHHFGAFASIGAALAALVTIAVMPAATRTLRNRVLFAAAVMFVLAWSFQSTNGWWYISIYGIPWGGTAPEIGGIRLATAFLVATVMLLLVALGLHYRRALEQEAEHVHTLELPPNGSAGKSDDTPARQGELWNLARAPHGVAAAMVVVLVVASMAAAVRNQYPAYSVGLQNMRALAGQPCGIADAVLVEPNPNEGVLEPLGDPVRQLQAGIPQTSFTPDGLSTTLTATVEVETDTVGTGEESDEVATTAGTDGGTHATTGLNGSHADLPFGLDPATVPVLGSYQSGPQFNAHTVTDWYRLPDRNSEQPLMVISVAGAFAPGSVQVEWSTANGPEFEVAGAVTPIEIGPEPAWRNLRVPLELLPEQATVVRVTARDDDPDPKRWIAITPPRIAELQTLQELVGDTRPVLPDWAVAFHTPCLRPFDEFAGVHELPEYRVLPDRSLAASSTNTWQSWDGGGPLGFIELLLAGETVPSYLSDDWDRDWGSLVRYSPLVPEATTAALEHDQVMRSGLWNGGPLAR